MARRSRPRLSVPFSGTLPHREHRSRKNRNKNGNRKYRRIVAARKREIEKIKIKDVEHEKD